MTNFEMAKKNYDRKLWTDDMIGNLVVKGKLSASEYEAITGNPYSGAIPPTVSTAELDNAYTQGVNEA